jgi:uncharacterized membrane protein (UPF0127 family)
MVNRNALLALSLLMTGLTMSMTSCNAKDQPVATTAAASTTSVSAANTTPADPAGPRVVLPDGTGIHVEVAADNPTREQGLMYRDRLADDRGMIFLFPATAEYSFWMKNTLIPLDMVWIDENHRIVHIAPDVPPCRADPCPSYPPNAMSKYVLELAAGVGAKHRLATGQSVRFEGFDNVAVQ